MKKILVQIAGVFVFSFAFFGCGQATNIVVGNEEGGETSGSAVVGSASISGVTSAESAEEKTIVRPENWAQPIVKPGLDNFFKVSDDLYRGARPTAEGFKGLKKLGVKTIINLEFFTSDRDRIQQSGADFMYVHIPMLHWHAENEDIAKFLKTVSQKENGPFYVHCMQGSDRTGLMSAVYRVVIQGWTKDQAIDEMQNGGFAFNFIWVNIVDYVRELDLGAFKAEVGI